MAEWVTYRDDDPKVAKRRREANVALIKRFYKLLNKANYKAIQKEILSEDHVDHTYFGSSPVKAQAITRIFNQIFESFPDWNETLDEIYANDGDTVVLRATGRGHQKGVWRGMKPPASGEPIAVPLIHIVRITFADKNFKNGRISEYRSTFSFENSETPDLKHSIDPEPGNRNADVQELRAERIVRDATKRGVRAASALDEIPLSERCQALIPNTDFRRCPNRVEEGSIYCAKHNKELMPGVALDPVHRAAR
jgi:hypothetical protein